MEKTFKEIENMKINIRVSYRTNVKLVKYEKKILVINF
jgi:hypothetical protein